MRGVFWLVNVGLLLVVAVAYPQDKYGKPGHTDKDDRGDVWGEPGSEVRRVRHKRFISEVVQAGTSLLGAATGVGGGTGPGAGLVNAALGNKQVERGEKFEREKLCYQICASEWSAWSSCSKPCGGGIRRRTREHDKPGPCSNFICPLSKKQEELCNPGCPNGGSPSNRGCSCRDGWKGDCCTIAVQCNYPGRPSDGNVQITWLRPSSYGNVQTTWLGPVKFRSVAKFDCEPGFALIGSSHIMCQADGTWTAKIPECKWISCHRPAQNDHVVILNNSTLYYYGDELWYTCDDEFHVLQGPEKRTCEAFKGTEGRWTGFDPICQATQCDDPGELNNGERHGHVFTHGSSVNFTCTKGYEIYGSSTMKCVEFGQWTGTFPKCIDINGCDNNPCYRGVQCIDVPAPGTGYRCGKCPTGLRGNGATCYL